MVITDYHVMVIAYATATVHEGQVPDPEELVGDDFLTICKRDAVRGMIANDPNYDPRAELMMKAFEMADISVKDAARILSAMTMLNDVKKRD